MTNDGFWLLILRKGQAFVPTMARTEAGFYVAIEPVAVVNARDQLGLERALIRTIRRGNPLVPTPSRANASKNPLLKHAKVKSTSSFDKLAKSWKFSKRNGDYFIIPYKKKERGQVEDHERGEAIPAEEPVEAVVRRLVRRALESDGGDVF